MRFLHVLHALSVMLLSYREFKPIKRYIYTIFTNEFALFTRRARGKGAARKQSDRNWLSVMGGQKSLVVANQAMFKGKGNSLDAAVNM